MAVRAREKTVLAAWSRVNAIIRPHEAMSRLNLELIRKFIFRMAEYDSCRMQINRNHVRH